MRESLLHLTLLAAALLACRDNKQNQKQYDVSVDSGRPCVLQVPLARGEVTIFPTGTGLDEWRRARTEVHGTRELEAVKVAVGSFTVTEGTRCYEIEDNGDVAHVMILEGRHGGTDGWVLTGWRGGH